MIQNPKTLASIDIGTNAVRLLIKYADLLDTLPDYKKAAYIRVPIRLGEDVFSKGVVGGTKKKLLAEAMQGFSHLLAAYKVDAFRACATSAMREAGNGKEIIQYIRKTSGIKIDIITGTEEAGLIFKAGEFETFIDRDKNYVYMDVGGGSTEIIVYSDHQAVSSCSFRLGTVRILSNAVGRKEPARFAEHLERVREEYRPAAIIGSGGNINKISKLLRKKTGEPVRTPELRELYDQLSALSFTERIEDLGLNSYRADVIVPALQLFLTAATTCGVDEIIVPKVGLVDGIIRSLYENGNGNGAENRNRNGKNGGNGKQ